MSSGMTIFVTGVTNFLSLYYSENLTFFFDIFFCNDALHFLETGSDVIYMYF